VDDLGRVQVLDATQNLVKEYFYMVLRQMLGRNNDLVEIRLHEFSYHVDLLKEVDVWRLKDV
jgi:hypothetical protein